MEESIQKLAIISFFIVGLSHIIQPKVWAKFFVYLADKEEIGSFINGFIHFPFGILIVSFHNVWSGIPIILTLIGYGLMIKDTIIFCSPKSD